MTIMQADPSRDKDLSFAKLSDLGLHIAVKMYAARLSTADRSAFHLRAEYPSTHSPIFWRTRS